MSRVSVFSKLHDAHVDCVEKIELNRADLVTLFHFAGSEIAKAEAEYERVVEYLEEVRLARDGK